MDAETRLKATRFVFGGYIFLMAILFLSTTDIGMQVGHVIIGIFMTLFTFVTNGIFWNWGNLSSIERAPSSKKTKNTEKLSAMLDRLSDEELDMLREKLNRGHDAYYLDDDGEIVRR
jgi:hypothetical protein